MDVGDLRTSAAAWRIFAVRTGIVSMHEKALSDYEKILKRDPADASSHMGMGRTLACLGRIDKALESIEEAMGLSPSAPLCAEHGKYLFAFRRHAEAASAFGHATELDPGDPVAHSWKGESLTKSGRPSDALACFEKAAELSPGSASVHNRLAVALLREERYTEANSSFTRAISLDSSDVTLQSDHDDHYWFGHDAPEPEETHPGGSSGSMGAHGHEGRVGEFFALGQATGTRSGTIGKLRQELALDPNDFDAYLGLGLAYLADRRYPAALEAFDWAVSINGGSLEAHFSRCRALALMGCHEDALSALDTAARLSPADAGFHLRKANSLCRLGFYSGAISACQNAIAIDSANPESHKTMAAVRTTFGLYGEALKSIDRAIRLVHNDAVSYVHRGYVLESLGRVSDAMGAFYHATQIGPGTWSLVPPP